jgi:ElaB/YqjD/DUF883 family membrane-anchored ribosome-binding protein
MAIACFRLLTPLPLRPLEGVAGAAADQMRDVTDRTGEVAGNFKRAVDKSVKEQPMTTLVMAAAIGFVLGALWKS